MSRTDKVLAGIVVAGFAILLWLVLDLVTPAECKVATEQMSAACQMLVQP